MFIISNIDTNSCFISCLVKLPPKQLSLLATPLGISLGNHLTLDQQNVVGNFIQSVGQSMQTAAAQAEYLQDGQSSDVQNQIDALKQQLEELKKRESESRP